MSVLLIYKKTQFTRGGFYVLLPYKHHLLCVNMFIGYHKNSVQSQVM